MKSAIEQEIIWCENHRGESGKGKDFEDGFLAGLKQALRFEDTVRVFEVESSNLSTPTEKAKYADSQPEGVFLFFRYQRFMCKGLLESRF